MRIASRWRLWAAACVAAFAAVAQGGEKHLWAEFIAFDNASADFGVAAYLSRMPVKPRGLSLLLADPEIVHAHAGLSRDFPLGDSQCSYFARPWNEERARQSRTAYQLRGLVAELKRHEVEVYPSFFDVSMAVDSGYLKRFGAVRKPSFWIDSHPEALCQARDGSRRNGVCVIKRLSDGTFYRDFFTRQLVRFLKDYGFAGWHACDGYGHPRVPVSEGDFSDDIVSQFVAEASAVPAAGMADLRVMSYRAANGARVVIALNDRAMYLDARIRLKGVPRDVRALTASPSLPVGVRPVEDGACVLSAKIPPQGVVVLACRFEKAEEIKS